MEKSIRAKKEYAAVDIFKFFCAILVIAIHAKPFVNIFWLDAGVGLLTRFAVPYFFLSSAYFLFLKLNKCGTLSEKTKVYVVYFIRLLRFYAIWFVVFNIAEVLLGAEIHSFWWYIKQFVFPTNGSSLWFVAALIWGSAIVFALTSFLNKKLVFVISLCFLAVGYLLSTMLSLTENLPLVVFLNTNVIAHIGVQNGLFFALPYVALGAVMAGKDFEKKYRRDILLTVLFFVILGVESIFAVIVCKAPFTFLWLSAVPMTYFVMRLTLTAELKNHSGFYYLRKMSTLIYVFHSVLVKLIIRLFNVLGISAVDSENILLFICTIAASVGLAYLIVYLSRFKKLSFLKYIM